VVRKYWLWIMLAATVLGLGVGAWLLRDQFTFAAIATGFAAKQTCSCIHVSGRSLESCLADLPEGADQLIVAADGEEVRATVLFGAFSARAAYEPEYGCQLLD
jgi:hypothetical protein